MKELFDVLGQYVGDCHIIECSHVPAMFDIRKRGVLDAVRSAVEMRSKLRRAASAMQADLVFDHLGPRERFLAGGHQARGLPSADNIYVAYRECLTSPNATLREPPLRPVGTARSVGIFPASRLTAKNLPRSLIQTCVSACLDLGLDPSIELLENERPDLEGRADRVRITPRGFGNLANAVRSVDVVLAADSLPAHMAEYFGRPVFVLTPVENAYWLPLSAHRHRRWSRFDEVAIEPTRLVDFLASR